MDKPTAKSPYPSAYGGGYISGSQYLAELACARIAKVKGQELAPKFWSGSWAKIFKHQVLLANGLLKLYSVKAIFAALRANPTVYSLNNPTLDDLIQAEQRKQERERPKVAEEKPVISPDTPENRPTFSKPSLRAKLEELE